MSGGVRSIGQRSKKAECEGRKIVFVDEGALYLLPGVIRSYAPDLNPKEGIWKHLKLVELKNLCCKNLAELKQAYGQAQERLRHKTEIIAACFSMAGLV